MLILAYITSVKSTPHQENDKWWVEVGYNCYGRESVTDLCFETQQQAKDISKGDLIDIYI